MKLTRLTLNESFNEMLDVVKSKTCKYNLIVIYNLWDQELNLTPELNVQSSTPTTKSSLHIFH